MCKSYLKKKKKTLGIAYKQSFKHITWQDAQTNIWTYPSPRRLGQQHQNNKTC